MLLLLSSSFLVSYPTHLPKIKPYHHAAPAHDNSNTLPTLLAPNHNHNPANQTMPGGKGKECAENGEGSSGTSSSSGGDDKDDK